MHGEIIIPCNHDGFVITFYQINFFINKTTFSACDNDGEIKNTIYIEIGAMNQKL